MPSIAGGVAQRFGIQHTLSIGLLGLVVGSVLSFFLPVSGVSSRNSAMPMTPFIGVRISWLMLARKDDLARLAASAVSFAWANSQLV